MKITSEHFDAGDSLLRITLEGSFSLAEAQLRFIDMLDGVVKHQAKKVLLDGRAIAGELGVLHRYLYGEFVGKVTAAVADHGLAQAPQFAYVLVEPVLDPGRVGQAAALTRGMKVKTFDNIGEAERWLQLVDQPSAH